MFEKDNFIYCQWIVQRDVEILYISKNSSQSHLKELQLLLDNQGEDKKHAITTIPRNFI